MAEKYPQRAVGEQIRQARIAAGLSQDALAEAVGRTRVTVSAWERGLSRPDDDSLPKLAKRLDLDPVELRLLGDAEQARDELERAAEKAAQADSALADYLGADARNAKRRATR